MAHLIAIDQGTTSTRAIVFDARLAPVATAQQELTQIYPAPGWVEHEWARTADDILWRRSKLGLTADAALASKLQRFLAAVKVNAAAG